MNSCLWIVLLMTHMLLNVTNVSMTLTLSKSLTMLPLYLLTRTQGTQNEKKTISTYRGTEPQP